MQASAFPASSRPASSWNLSDPDSRKIALKAIFIDRAATDHLSETINSIRRDNSSLSEPACALVLGETGTGKSTFLKHYQAVHSRPPYRVKKCLVQEVLYAELLSNSTVITCAQTILRLLRDPSKSGGRLGELTYRVIDQLIAQKVEAVLIDEFQHITDTGDKTLNKAGDWLKQVCKASGVPFVLAGMSTASRILDANTQFAGITPYRYELGKFSYESISDRTVFRTFLARLDDALPFADLSGFADPGPAELLFAATSGNLRALMRLINKAALHAIDRGAVSMATSDLAFGFDHIGRSNALTGNPFANALLDA